MAVVNFTGNESASNGTSLLVIEGMTNFTLASFNGELEGGGNRLNGLFARNDGSGATSQSTNMSMTTESDGREIVTALQATGGTSSGSSTVLNVSGLRLGAQFDNTDVFSSANLTEYQRILNDLFAGDDQFILSGAISRIWGDYQSAPLGGTVTFGDDIISAGGATRATFVSAATIYGDAQTVASGAQALAGDDIIDVGPFTATPFKIFGDFETVDGKVAFGDDQIFGGSGNDILFGDSLTSGKKGGNDFIAGFSGSNQIFAGGGDDFIKGGSGADTVDGGAGFDIFSYVAGSTLLSTMIVDLIDSSQNTNVAQGDVLTNVEGLKGRNNTGVVDDLRGNALNNKILGLAGADILSGRGGADQLFGGTEDDSLRGGVGNDVLTGGPGADHFVFNTALNASNNVDTITDFKPVNDTIDISLAIMPQVANGTGTLFAAAFFSSASGNAHDGSDRILYETDTGRLFYDPDGTGNADRILFAIVGKNLAITSADFEII